MLARTLLLLALLAPPVAAHDFWILPAGFAPAPDAPFSVRLMVGEHGAGAPVARRDERILRFELLSAAGARPVVGRDGDEPAGAVRPAGEGAAWLVYANTPARIELEGDSFEAYLREEGLEAVLARRAARGESARAARESYARCAKAWLRVGGAARDGDAALASTPLGLPLELVPEGDPAAPDPATGGALRVRLLFEGRPLDGALVEAVPLREAAPPPDALPAAVQARTDAAGRAALTLPHGGGWLVTALHVREAAGEVARTADYESWWASLTFALP